MTGSWRSIPKNADALLHRGQVLRRKGRGELALGVYDAFLTHYPDSMGIWQIRAEVLLELHRYPDALESVEKALSFDPEWKEWNMAGGEELRGDILGKLQHHQDALAAYDRVLSKAPGWNSAAIWGKKAGSFFALAEYPQVVAACDRAIELADQERQDTGELTRLRDAARQKMT
jgi:tetratricopeptide (TPR) repeat protein